MITEILKKIGTHTLLYSFGNILSRIVGFLMIPLYTHYLTPSDYGTIELLDLTSYVIGMIIGAGMGAAILRFYYEFRDQTQKNQVISTALIFLVPVNLLVLVVLFYFSRQVSLLVFDTDKYSSYLELVFVSLSLGALYQLSMSYVRAKQQSLRYTVFSLLQLALGLSLNIYLIAKLHMGVWGVLYSSVITNAVMVVFLLSMTIFEVKLSFSFGKLKQMLKYGVPLIPASIGMFVLTFADRFFLQKYATLSVVGTYALGYKLGMVINALLVSPFLLFWSAYMYEVAEKQNAKELFARIQEYFAFVLLFVALGVSLLANDVVKILSPPQYWEASRIVPIIALSYVFLGFQYFFQVGINLTKKTKFRALAVGGSALLNLILNYLLIPSYAALGAALATLFSFMVMAMVTHYFSQRLYPVRYELSKLLKIGAIGLAIYGLSQIVPVRSAAFGIALDLTLLVSFPFVLWTANFYRDEEKAMVRRAFSFVVGRLGIAMK